MPATSPIFTASSGRAGSEYLATLLDTTLEAAVSHEPEPRMIATYTQMVNKRPYARTYRRRRTKARAVARAVAAVEGPKTIYGETSHMFIKTFHDVVLDRFPDATVIILRRPIMQTMKSFIDLGYYTDANRHWPDWMTSPNAKTAALPAIAPDEALDSVDLTIAYLLDIEARAQRLQRDRPTVRTVETSLEEITKPDGATRLLDELDLTASDATAELIGRRKNDKAHRKERVGVHIDPATCQERLGDYVRRGRQHYGGTALLDVFNSSLERLTSDDWREGVVVGDP